MAKILALELGDSEVKDDSVLVYKRDRKRCELILKFNLEELKALVIKDLASVSNK